MLTFIKMFELIESYHDELRIMATVAWPLATIFFFAAFICVGVAKLLDKGSDMFIRSLTEKERTR